MEGPNRSARVIGYPALTHYPNLSTDFMSKTVAEPYRDIDFTHARRGPVVPSDPGNTRIAIHLDIQVLDYFRDRVEQAGGGNYQALINQALRDYIQQQSLLEAVRQVMREELRPIVEKAKDSGLAP